jgi:serine protease AprX
MPLLLFAAAGSVLPVVAPAQAPCYDANGDKIFENLAEQVVQSEGPIPVIVMLNEPASGAALSHIQSIIGEYQIKYVYDVIPGFAATLTSKQIAALAMDASVKQIEYDAECHALLGTAQTWYGTAKARTDFGVTGDRDGNPTSYTKNDIVVTILDTGIDPNHMDLDGGKIIAWKDFVNSRTTAYDDHGHGTHCASIATGTGDANATYKGVAPGAALVGVKVLNSAGSGSTSTIVNGINWVVTNKATYGIRVLSISLGSTGSSNGQDALSVACNNAVNAGIVVCVAEGNSGPAKYTTSTPAAAANVITVGAMSDCGENGYFLAYFSSRGPTADGRTKPDICAPGWYITAAKAGTTNQYVTMSGTSMSTPFTAGTAALMLAANPNLTPAQIKTDLMTTAQDWGPTGTDIDYGAGRLQGYDAIKLAGGYTGTGPTVPPHVYKSEALGSKGKTDIWTVNVNSTSYPIAASMIMPNWSSSTNPNFDISLYNPSGTKVTSGVTKTREDYIAYAPTVTGNYKLYVTATAGSGSYFFDLSCANASSIVLTQNQFGSEPGNPEVMTEGVSPLTISSASFRNDRASFAFSLVQAGNVRISVFDGTGRAVATSALAGIAGHNEANIGLPNLNSGVYFYRLETANTVNAGKFALVR